MITDLNKRIHLGSAFGMIMPAPTGVTWASTTGGILCRTSTLEGIFYPLPDDWKTWINERGPWLSVDEDEDRVKDPLLNESPVKWHPEEEEDNLKEYDPDKVREWLDVSEPMEMCFRPLEVDEWRKAKERVPGTLYLREAWVPVVVREDIDPVGPPWEKRLIKESFLGEIVVVTYRNSD